MIEVKFEDDTGLILDSLEGRLRNSLVLLTLECQVRHPIMSQALTDTDLSGKSCLGPGHGGLCLQYFLNFFASVARL